MELVREYENLHSSLQKQIDEIYTLFIDNKEIKISYEKTRDRLRGKGIDYTKYKNLLWKLCVLHNIKAIKLIDERYLNIIKCYHSDKNSDNKDITLHKIIQDGEHAKVLEGIYNGTEVIVKWHKHDEKDITYEFKIYNELKKSQCNLPYFNTSYMLWGTPVLVLEKLKPISRNDDEFQMGIHILETLKELHKFGVHCDIKPGNIMKRDTGHNVEYILIDYLGATLEEFDYGYKRHTWSRDWTCQEHKKHNQVVTAKHDFKELGFVMRYLQLRRELGTNNLHHKCKHGHHYNDDKDQCPHGCKNPCQYTFDGKLAKYMKNVKEINKHDIKHDIKTGKIHDRLIRILKS